MKSPLLTLASYESIASGVAERLSASRNHNEPLAAWNEEVLVASNGVAQSIASALIARNASGVAAVQLQTIETFARRVLNAAGEFPRIATDEERRLAMRTATRSLDDPLAATRGAAAMLERSYRDVRDSGITIGELSRRVAAARTLRNRERIRLALRAWQLYEKLIAKLGCVDPADVLARAADLILAGASVRPQIAAGFYDATGAQMAVLQALQAVEKLAAAYVPADDAFAQPFIRAFGPPAEAGGYTEAKYAVLASRTREEEVRDTCAAIAQLLASGAKPSSIGIAARSLDPYDVTLFARFSSEYGFEVSESVGAPLAGHRFARGIIHLVRLRERNFLRADVLEIARSGLKLASRINADKVDYETRRASIAGGKSADLRQRTFRSPVINDYIALVEELDALTDRIDAAWLTKIIERFRLEDEVDVRVVESLQRIAAMCERATAWNRPFDTASLIDTIENAEQPRADRSSQTPVWLGDVMRLRGRAFEHLFAIRMQEDVVPQRRVEDPLLIDADRCLLALREIGDGRAEEQLLFGVLRRAARHVNFSFAATDGFGKPLRKSHYLRAFPSPGASRHAHLECGVHDAALGARKAAAWPPHSRSGTGRLRPLQMLARAGTQGVFDGYIRSDVVRDRAIAALQSISPTYLEDFGECPQKFLWKQLLGVRDLDDPEMQMQIDHREKGNVDHKILERFYAAVSEDALRDAMAALPLLPQSIVDALDRFIDEEFENLEDRIPPYNAPVRRIEQNATRRVLRQFVAQDLTDLAVESLVPKRFEFRFDPLLLDIEGTTLRIEGKIDRIDESPGRMRIVDYKSGKALRHVKLAEKIDRGVRLQLALYALAMIPPAEAGGYTETQITGVIKPIAGTSKLADYSFDLEERETRLRETLRLFVAAIQRGDFPAFPNEKDNDYNACKYCPVNHSCRTRHDAEEKRTVLRVSEPRALFEEPVA